MKKLRHVAYCSQKAFTLVELLMVISIIGLLAALIVGLAGVAGKKSRISRVQAELAQWETLIENYKDKKGSYPPDNRNNPAINPLFYELAGTIFKASPAPSYRTISGEFTINQAAVSSLFGVGGFLNSAEDGQDVLELYRSRKTSQYFEMTINAVTAVVLGVPVDGPVQFTDVSGRQFNPWRYVSSNATNNPNSFDLWMDIRIGGKNYRICHWSKEPIAY